MVFSRKEHLKKIGFQKGYKPWNKDKRTGLTPMLGKKHKPESIDKIRKNSLREEKSPHWKNKLTYIGIHAWVYRKLGKPMECQYCGIKDLKKYNWHNISGEYLRDTNDWIRLCLKCHYKADRKIINV